MSKGNAIVAIHTSRNEVRCGGGGRIEKENRPINQ